MPAGSYPLPDMSRTGVMICGHGSRDDQACVEFARVVDAIASQAAGASGGDGLSRVRPADHPRRPRPAARPGASTACWRCPACCSPPATSRTTCRRCSTPTPPSMASGSRWAATSASTPSCCAPSRDRIAAALERGESDVGLDETCLVVVGRGTSDSDANGNVAKVARMLWEGMGFAQAEIGYSGVAHPRTEVALERAAPLGFRRIVVFPYFLFTGILVRRIYDATDAVAARHPGDRVRQGALSRRPSAGDRHLRRAHPRHRRRRRQHELLPVQVPHPGDRLRARRRRAAGEPPPPCRGHRHRRRASSPPSRPRPRSWPSSPPTTARGPGTARAEAAR